MTNYLDQKKKPTQGGESVYFILQFQVTIYPYREVKDVGTWVSHTHPEVTAERSQCMHVYLLMLSPFPKLTVPGHGVTHTLRPALPRQSCVEALLLGTSRWRQGDVSTTTTVLLWPLSLNYSSPTLAQFLFKLKARRKYQARPVSSSAFRNYTNCMVPLAWFLH